MYSSKKILIKITILIIYLGIQDSVAQTAFANLGNIQIHDGGKIGFHTNLINDGNFDTNEGMAGFYNEDKSLSVSGTNEAIFNNVEVAVNDNLELYTSLGVKNNFSFINGNVVTPRNDLNVSLDFINYNVYSGESDFEYVDGYAASNNEGEFVFPIGDNDELRPMIIPAQTANTIYEGAYFKENPNNPTTFDEQFDTTKKINLLENINTSEFWDLNGTEETDIVLTWNVSSKIRNITKDIENLRVVGWDKDEKEWKDLGAVEKQGDLDNGWVKSNKFIPEDYEIITIGADFRQVLGEVTFATHNYGFSPNGDGLHDTFTIEGIDLRPNNTLKVYNRWGALVYQKDNYNNTWDGTSENKLTIKKANGLPVGVYFYVLYLRDENKKWTGYIYLNR
jgi:gliding motility-associated-like protein